MDAEAHLSAVENGSYGDPGEAMGALAEAVDAVNREMGGEPDGKRIRQLVTRLQKATATVAAQSGASGFSISVGFPLGVSVSVEWGIAHSADDAGIMAGGRSAGRGGRPHG